tara:strand:+ start:1216 stop:1383 length:168 start_codon:yes stop_codon:yes gene_type:complete
MVLEVSKEIKKFKANHRNIPFFINFIVFIMNYEKAISKRLTEKKISVLILRIKLM